MSVANRSGCMWNRPRRVRGASGAERLQRIWDVVASIPRGRVSTYGEVADAAGLVRGARQVGRALRLCPPRVGLPWHRVLAAGGRIALDGPSGLEQRLRLRHEGVAFSGGRVRLDLYRWDFRGP